MHPRIGRQNERSEKRTSNGTYQSTMHNARYTSHMHWCMGFFLLVSFLKNGFFVLHSHYDIIYDAVAANKLVPCAELESILSIALEMFE